ncbi:unnamed protein product [Candidula unifasciata]|uniref:Uncharacterized protein n=1 Tax=Candidula unifasciata TaxID=100452 RepID=A0A8S3YSC7_9EUPU|nr:unnamed protein product [Candidula unifasciata]
MAGDEAAVSDTNSLKQLYLEFSGSTSMHGIGRALSNSSTWKRCVWSVMFLFGLGFAVYQFVITMQDFYTYPVNTVVTLKHETTAIFPAVTICNLNTNRKSMIDSDLLAALESLEETEEAPEEAILKGLLQNDYTGVESGHQMSDMLIKCLFNRLPCSEANFSLSNTVSYGTCYTFQIEDPLIQYVTRPGPKNGLILELNIEQYEYLPTTSSAGVNVMVHPLNEIPFPEDGGILAHPGAVTRVGIKQEITQRLPSPYSNCISANGQSSSQRSFFQNTKYMQNACMKSCYQMRLYETCGCCDVDLPCNYYDILSIDRTTTETNNSLPLCETFDDFLCKIEVEILFLKSELDCDERCPPVCASTTYHTVVSTAQWPPDSKIEIFLDTAKSTFLQNVSFTENNSSEKFIRSNLLRLEIFLDSLEFKEFTTQAKYDWNLLLGTIGGLLGLGLGFSLLTAMEIVEVLIETVLYCAHRKYQKKKNMQI